jgi:hypothetical protein
LINIRIYRGFAKNAYATYIATGKRYFSGKFFVPRFYARKSKTGFAFQRPSGASGKEKREMIPPAGGNLHHGLLSRSGEVFLFWSVPAKLCLFEIARIA